MIEQLENSINMHGLLMVATQSLITRFTTSMLALASNLEDLKVGISATILRGPDEVTLEIRSTERPYVLKSVLRVAPKLYIAFSYRSEPIKIEEFYFYISQMISDYVIRKNIAISDAENMLDDLVSTLRENGLL